METEMIKAEKRKSVKVELIDTIPQSFADFGKLDNKTKRKKDDEEIKPNKKSKH